MYSEEFSIGADKQATITNIETKIIFKVRIFLLIRASILDLSLIILITSKHWAIISNIINPKRTNLLKNLYKSTSKLTPRKIEWKIRNLKNKK